MPFVCLNMNGRAQFYMNIAITLMFGVYGVVGVLYSELIKPEYEWRGGIIAINLLVLLSLIAAIFSSALRVYSILDDDREFHDRKGTQLKTQL